jgi:hypothetical protein
MLSEKKAEKVFLARLPANLTLAALDGLELIDRKDQLQNTMNATLFGNMGSVESSEGRRWLHVGLNRSEDGCATLRWAGLQQSPAGDLTLEAFDGTANIWIANEPSTELEACCPPTKLIGIEGATTQQVEMESALAPALQRTRLAADLASAAKPSTQLPLSECRQWRERRQESAKRLRSLAQELEEALGISQASLTRASDSKLKVRKPGPTPHPGAGKPASALADTPILKPSQTATFRTVITFDAAVHLRTKYITKYRRKPCKYTRKILKRPEQYLREPFWMPVATPDGEEIATLVSAGVRHADPAGNEEPLIELSPT